MVASSSIKSYRDLIVWQKAMLAVYEIYRLTKTFPDDEKYGLTSQILRASVSIPSNIAEGSRKVTAPEKRNYLRIALGSTAELETQLEIAAHVRYIQTYDYDKITSLIDEIVKMLTKMIAKC